VLRGGRWIDHEDYLNANNVVVVHEWFADMRGLELGDLITIEFTREQMIIEDKASGLHALAPGFFHEVNIVSSIGYQVYELELEIVGTFRSDHDLVGHSHYTFLSHFIYIPDSILPHDFKFSALPYEPSFEQDVSAWIREWPVRYTPEMLADPTFLPDVWYSFVLKDARDEAIFLREYSERLTAMGFNLILIEQDSELFWASAEPILQAAELNAVVFSILMVLILIFTSYLYLRHRKKEFAILRALGVCAQNIYLQLSGSVLLFGLPSVVIGGTLGWFFALNAAESTVNPLGEIAAGSIAGFSTEIDISAIWLIAMIAAVFAALLMVIMIGALRIIRRPVLTQLQGRG
jgi:hypothetical protein